MSEKLTYLLLPLVFVYEPLLGVLVMFIVYYKRREM